MSGPVRWQADVGVLGGGPAGVAAAVGLARLGWSVCLLSGGTRQAVEGASQRVLESLRRQQLERAAASLDILGGRTRDWAGSRLANGHEYLVLRPRFDEALLADAQAAGVDTLTTRVEDVQAEAGGWTVTTRTDVHRFRALIDARGRRLRAPAVRGPRLLAMTRAYELGASPACTGVASAESAWYWYACDGQGRGWITAVQPAAGAALSRRQATFLEPRCTSARRSLQASLFEPTLLPPLVREVFGKARPGGPPRACAAGAFWREPAVEPGRVLAGDAMLALDPLSGHGIYEALAMAPAVIAAANTHLSRGDWAPVRRFLAERGAESWARKMQAAAGFYSDLAKTQASWQPTACGYERAGQRDALPSAAMGIDWRPVLAGPRIELRRVLVTPSFPRGLWRHGDVELAALLDGMKSQGEDADGLARRLGRAPADVYNAVRWLAGHGVTMRSSM